MIVTHLIHFANSTDGLTSIKPNLPHASTGQGAIKNILTIVFVTIGSLSVLMITVSGLRYILAGGDPGKVSKAKNGIIYSLVGLVIAISAQAIVSFVVNGL